MYLSFGSGLHGQGTSSWPGLSGMPTECRHGMNSPSLPSTLRTASPMRVMMRMFTTTYGESESCTPMCAMSEPIGPMLNGITYIVRPRIEPSNFGVRRAFIFSGSIQLFVGPASSWVLEQMYVRSSTRATSLGWLRARKQPGRNSGFSLMNVPPATISSQSRSYSSCEPLHQYTWSGLHSAAVSSTQFSNSWFREGVLAWSVCVAMLYSHRRYHPPARNLNT